VNVSNESQIQPDEDDTPKARGLLWRSALLGLLSGSTGGVIYWVCLLVVGMLDYRWGAEFHALDYFALLLIWCFVTTGPGAVGGVAIAVLYRAFARQRGHEELRGAICGALVGFASGVAPFPIMWRFYIQVGDEPRTLAWLVVLVVGLGIPISAGLVHGRLLARWSRGGGWRWDRLGWALIVAGSLGAFFVLFSLTLGVAGGLSRRQAAILSAPVTEDMCRKLALPERDPRCNQGARVHAHDFFPEIRGLVDKGMTYEQIERMFGAYKVSCGATLHKAPGDEGYFVCLYDLKGNERYWFTFEFTTGGALTSASTSSAPPPP
jgi:hypothetical protein